MKIQICSAAPKLSCFSRSNCRHILAHSTLDSYQLFLRAALPPVLIIIIIVLLGGIIAQISHICCNSKLLMCVPITFYAKVSIVPLLAVFQHVSCFWSAKWCLPIFTETYLILRLPISKWFCRDWMSVNTHPTEHPFRSYVQMEPFPSSYSSSINHPPSLSSSSSLSSNHFQSYPLWEKNFGALGH